MDDDVKEKYYDMFDKIKHVSSDGSSYFLARELYAILEYKSYRKFVFLIKRAKEICFNNGFFPSEHFICIEKTINLANGESRKIKDFRLTFIACYYIAVICDLKKEGVAAFRMYFKM